MGILIISILLSVYVYKSTNQIEENQYGQNVIRRNEKGVKGHQEKLIVEIGGEKQSIDVTVSNLNYTKEELAKTFDTAIDSLESLIIGENKSLDNVRHDLELIRAIPETGIRVGWELDSYQHMDPKGNFQDGTLSDEGAILGLKAILTYEGATVIHEMYAHLYPKEYSPFDNQVKALMENLEKEDKETRYSEYLILPSQVENQPISWQNPTNYDFIGIIFLGITATFLLLLLEKQKEKEALKRRKNQMTLDYPKIISTFTLFLEAGMTPRNAWFKIVQTYLKQKDEKNVRHAYEEMLVTMYEIKGGRPEAACYESFGNRCGIIYYRKFGGIVAQNIKKGTKGMAAILKAQVEQAREERKNTAKRLGEEAGTKLLLPMFLMLGIVLVVIIIPAFLSIQV